MIGAKTAIAGCFALSQSYAVQLHPLFLAHGVGIKKRREGRGPNLL